MKITDNRKKPVEFEDIKCGDVFSYNGNIYMKTELAHTHDGECVNSVCLEDGELNVFVDDTEVMPIICELVIK